MFSNKIKLSKAESLKLGVNSMSNLNAQSVQLQGTLYIGFPKTFSGAHMETLFDEISDYIDNNCDLTLADLQADSDYAQLQFQQHMPTLADKTNFFFMDVEIYVATLKENFGHTSVLDQVTSVNIFGKNLEDICTLMAQNGYAYDRIEDCWSRELS